MEDEVEVENQYISATPSRVQHVKKRSLKNKSISITFDEEDLRNYVTGFHKRKKKRRKEALKQQEEAKRRKRIEQRKKRKQERDYVMFGGDPRTADSTAEGGEEYDEVDGDGEQVPSVSGTTTYDNGGLRVTVITSEISRDDEEVIVPSKKIKTALEERPAAKKRPFKSAAKQKPRSKSRNRKDNNKKGKNKGKGR